MDIKQAEDISSLLKKRKSIEVMKEKMVTIVTKMADTDEGDTRINVMEMYVEFQDKPTGFFEWLMSNGHVEPPEPFIPDIAFVLSHKEMMEWIGFMIRFSDRKIKEFKATIDSYDKKDS